MAESIVADLAARLITKLASLAAEELVQVWNLDKGLEKLQGRFSLISSLLNDAHNKNITMLTTQIWFNKLEDVASVTEAFMDELAYEVTRRNVENRCKVMDYLNPSKIPLINRHDVARKIKSIQASFDEIFQWARELGLNAVVHSNSAVQLRDIRSVSPFQDPTLIVGRDEDISNLVQIICKYNEHDLNVVAIIGMGGQGKTTLASMVFHNDAVIKMFTKRMWITVSDDFNYVKILNQMVQSLTSKNLGLDNTQGLVNELQRSIKGEQFLLVLDDVWNEASEKWDDLRNSLLGVGGAKGSSVLVTTRNQEVIYAMRNSVCHRVEKLQDDDSYELFKKIAFGDGGVSEIEPFADMGRSMVERCGGLPLAIKALAGMLGSKDSEQEWRKIQNSEIWSSQDVCSKKEVLHVLPSLRLSYDNLPYSSLKRCFVYCSIIPKDTRIYKAELIQIWMALGFLSPPFKSDAVMEDIGNEYFSILLWHSLLQDIKRDEFGNIESCKMHDLVHDLALNLSKQYSVTVKTGYELDHGSEATYLRLDNQVSNINPKIMKRGFEKVRLLYAGACDLRVVLPYIAHLTVLVLSYDVVGDKEAKELPKSLRNMKYIKHLDISCLPCKVPSYITELYNLQTLRVKELEVLPKKFCNLINLRHLYIEYPSRCMFNGIERLTCLQTLPHFVVSKDQNCHIKQLKGLHNLRGEVNLYGLTNVANKEEASKAKLCRKSDIQSLLLNWETDKDESINNSEEAHVIEGLEPHTNLKELIIEDYMGRRLASWIAKMENLVKITLSHCEKCEDFPLVGHLPNLREMKVKCMHKVRNIGSNGGAAGNATRMYPSLTKLSLRDLPMLEEWLEPCTSRVSGDRSSVEVFPKLEVLDIDSCSKLTRIPDSCFPCLKNLRIHNYDSSNMILEPLSLKVSSLRHLEISKGHVGDEEGSSCLSIDNVFENLLKNNSQYLTYLKINNCRGLTRLTVGVALNQLELLGCPDLTSINAFEETSCLRYVEIKKCPCLLEFPQSLSCAVEFLITDKIPRAISCSVISFPNLTTLGLCVYEEVKSTLEFDDSHVSAFSALTRLTVNCIKGLKTLPDTIAKLPFLEELSIWGCEDLESLPTFEPSHAIRCLDILDCDTLKSRCKKNGPEWYKIQHIPIIKGIM